MAAAIPPKISKWFDVFVSIAAAIVIYGALQKLLHTPIADFMLKVGLTVEAIIFMGYGLLYLIYPAIDDHEVHLAGKNGKGNSAMEKLDKMMEEAEITPDAFTKLSAGFQKLNTAVEQIADITGIANAANDFSAKANEANVAMSGIKDAVNNANQSLAGFHGASESSKQFHVQMQSLNKNLTSLNTIYELELQEGNSHLKAMNQFYGKLTQVSAAMVNSADDAIKAKDQIATMAANLSKLNQLYGNMLTAMQGK